MAQPAQGQADLTGLEKWGWGNFKLNLLIKELYNLIL